MLTKNQRARKLRERRERLRQQRHEERFSRESAVRPPPALHHPYAAERAMHEMHAALSAESFKNVDEMNAHLERLNASGGMHLAATKARGGDPKWRAQQLAYDALEADDPVDAAYYANEALALDEDCIDAHLVVTRVVPITLENRIDLLQELVQRAEGVLGSDFFDKNAGRFWGVLETRPYMRARQELAVALDMAGREEEAIENYEAMIELNPKDNQGVRDALLGLYLAMARVQEARDLMDRYKGEENVLANAAWSRVLERYLSGDVSGAQAALENARKVNRHAENYLSGKRAVPEDIPGFYRPGDESEAQVCAVDLGRAWRRHPDAMAWLTGSASAR